MSQEPTLFATSIYDNISIGKEGATEEEVEAAARAANAWNFITNLPKKFETQVGERGVQLSGGQKQRIAIARAILKNPKVMGWSQQCARSALSRYCVETCIFSSTALPALFRMDALLREYACKMQKAVPQGTFATQILN